MSMWDKIKELFSEVATFCGPFMKQFETAAGPIVLAAAEQVVATYVGQAIPGAQKQAGAYNDIVANLKQQGITVGASVINSAIEAAVAKLVPAA